MDELSLFCNIKTCVISPRLPFQPHLPPPTPTSNPAAHTQSSHTKMTFRCCLLTLLLTLGVPDHPSILPTCGELQTHPSGLRSGGISFKRLSLVLSLDSHIPSASLYQGIYHRKITTGFNSFYLPYLLS